MVQFNLADAVVHLEDVQNSDNKFLLRVEIIGRGNSMKEAFANLAQNMRNKAEEAQKISDEVVIFPFNELFD